MSISTSKIPINLPKTKPVIGFIGGTNLRIHFKLLYQVAHDNPQWQFVLIGPQQAEDTEKKQLNDWLTTCSHLPNLLTIPGISREHIPKTIALFDIAMIPYDISQPFNRYCYPMKLFEYFYMGKPVISTPIEELQYFPEFVKIGKTPKDWQHHIKHLLATPWTREKKLQQKRLAECNSWQKKINRILKIIDYVSKKNI